MKKILAVVALVGSLCGGCVSDGDCDSCGRDPIVSPEKISTDGGSGEIQIPHYVPTWYESK